MNLINSKLVKNAKATTTLKIFEEIADALVAEGSIANKKILIDGFKNREKQGSTALVEGFAIPHTVNSEIESPKVVVLKKANVSDWETLDGTEVDTVIAIVVPENGRGDHLTILSKLSGKLANADFAKSIKTSAAAKVVEDINSVSIEEETKAKSENGKYDIVAVTACPTGIAHTYMSAEYLEGAAKEMGLTIKVETQGQTVQNILTQEEIDGARAIIIAVDREVDLSRFANKKVIKTGTKKVIADATGHIERALANDGIETIPSTVKSTGGASAVSGEGELSLHNFGSRAWKAVMNGVSFMLPFVIFGGILTALSFLIDTAAGNGDAGSALGSTNSVAAFFNSLGGVSMGLMVPVLTAYTMFALIGRPGLLPGFVIGMLAAGNGPSFVNTFGLYGESGVPTWLTDIQPGFAGTVPASGFIGGIVGAFYATVVVVGVSKVLDYLPKSLRGIKQILLLPLLGTSAAAITFWFLNIPLIYLTWGLLAGLSAIDSWGATWLLAMIVAGMMAVDMGGPVNKTAYVFGTVMMGVSATAGGTFDAGYVYMAAVMAGGMVPPLAIAIATLFGRKTLWDDQDKEGGVTNWIMGASFITEGAIPFVSKYPKSLYLPNILGAAVAGLIVGIFGVGIAAPHGGIFVIALVQFGTVWLGALIYIAAILIGSFVSALLIVFLRSREVAKQQ